MFVEYLTFSDNYSKPAFIKEIAEFKNITYAIDYECAIIELRGFCPITLPMSVVEYNELVTKIRESLNNKVGCLVIEGATINLKESDFDEDLDDTISQIKDTWKDMVMAGEPFDYKFN